MGEQIFTIKYAIVDTEGDIIFHATVWMTMTGRRPATPEEEAEATRGIMRKLADGADQEGNPPGRIVLLAVLPGRRPHKPLMPEDGGPGEDGEVRPETVYRLSAELRAAHDDEDLDRLRRKVQSIAERHGADPYALMRLVRAGAR